MKKNSNLILLISLFTVLFISVILIKAAANDEIYESDRVIADEDSNNSGSKGSVIRQNDSSAGNSEYKRDSVTGNTSILNYIPVQSEVVQLLPLE
jgi:hypothetical protein